MHNPVDDDFALLCSLIVAKIELEKGGDASFINSLSHLTSLKRKEKKELETTVLGILCLKFIFLLIYLRMSLCLYH